MSTVSDPSKVRRPDSGGWMRRFEIALLSGLFLAIVGIGLTQIVLRNFADSSLVWADAAMRAGVLWIAMLAAALAAGERKHIRIDVVLGQLPDRARVWVERILFGLTALICIALAAASVSLVELEWSLGDLAFLGVPRWLVLVILPLGFGVMGWRFLRHAFGLWVPRRAGQDGARR